MRISTPNNFCKQFLSTLYKQTFPCVSLTSVKRFKLLPWRSFESFSSWLLMWEPFLPRIHHFNGTGSSESGGKCFQVLIILTKRKNLFQIRRQFPSTLRFHVFRLINILQGCQSFPASISDMSWRSVAQYITRRFMWTESVMKTEGAIWGQRGWLLMTSCGERLGDANRLTSCQYFYSLSLLNLKSK